MSQLSKHINRCLTEEKFLQDIRMINKAHNLNLRKTLSVDIQKDLEKMKLKENMIFKRSNTQEDETEENNDNKIFNLLGKFENGIGSDHKKEENRTVYSLDQMDVDDNPLFQSDSNSLNENVFKSTRLFKPQMQHSAEALKQFYMDRNKFSSLTQKLFCDNYQQLKRQNIKPHKGDRNKLGDLEEDQLLGSWSSNAQSDRLRKSSVYNLGTKKELNLIRERPSTPPNEAKPSTEQNKNHSLQSPELRRNRTSINYKSEGHQRKSSALVKTFTTNKFFINSFPGCTIELPQGCMST